MLIQVLILSASLFALYLGAELVLESGEKIGRHFKLSPLMVGLLLIGFGTSLPELFVGHLACLKGEAEIALGNIVGSNITNLFLIMGIAGLCSPLAIFRNEIKMQLWLHLAVTLLLTVLLFLIGMNLMGTVVSLSFFVFHLWVSARQMKKNAVDLVSEDESQLKVMVLLKLLAGFILLYAGGEFLISSGVALANFLHISPYVISAIILALGTSLPELITALIACIKGKDTGLIIGNILGSNVFNVALVLGSISYYKFPVTVNLTVEVAALFFASFFMLALFGCKKNFGRIAGVIFLSGYGLMLTFWLRG